MLEIAKNVVQKLFQNLVWFFYYFFFETFKSLVNIANVVINFKKLLGSQLNKGLFYFYCSLAPELFMTCLNEIHLLIQDQL